MGVRVDVLGPLQASRDGEPVALTGRIALRLMATLTAAEGPASTETLSDAVWGANPPASAASALRVHLTRLRRLLGAEAIETVPGGYRLSAGVDLDIHRLGHLVRAAEQRAPEDPASALRLFHEALELWRGDPWEDIADGLLLTSRRRELVAEHLSLQERWASLVVDVGRGPDHIDELERLARDEPLREERWANLLVALHQAGRDAEALRLYDEVRDLLANDLGTVPGPLIQRAYDHVVAGPTSRSAALGTVHRRLTSLVGRQQDIAAAETALSSSRLVTLMGIGGIGKTRIAEEVLQRARRQGLSTSWLAVPDVATSAGLVRDLAAQLGAHPPTEEDAIDTVTHLLTGVDLLVIDGGETTSPGLLRLLAWILDHRPRLRILATARAPLGLSGEATRSIGPLPIPETGEPTEGSAVELLARIRGSDPDDPTILAGLAEECRAAGGVPLLIELSGRRTRSTRREDTTDALSATVRDTLAGLDGPLRQVTSAVAVLPAGLTDSGAAAQARDASPDRWLSYLTWCGLVDTRTAGHAISYRMLDPVRDAVLAEICDVDRAQVWDSLAEHLTSIGTRLRPSLDVAPRYSSFAALDAEGANVAALLDQARPDRLQLVESLAAYLGCRGHAADARAWVADDLASDDPAVAANAALLGARVGRFSETLVPLTDPLLDAVTHFEQAGDPVRAASAGLYATLATCYGQDVAAGRDVIERVTPLLTDATPWLRAMIGIGHGFVSLLEWDLTSARTHILDAEAVFVDSDPGGLALARYLRGIFALLRETEDQSALLAAARADAESVGDLPLIGLCRFAEIGAAPRGGARVTAARRAAEALDAGGLTDWAAQARMSAARVLIDSGTPHLAAPDILAAIRPLSRTRPAAVRLALSGLAVALVDTETALAGEVAAAARARPATSEGEPGERSDWLEGFEPTDQPAPPLETLLVKVVECLEPAS